MLSTTDYLDVHSSNLYLGVEKIAK